jgi:hypothetical protein
MREGLAENEGRKSHDKIEEERQRHSDCVAVERHL